VGHRDRQLSPHCGIRIEIRNSAALRLRSLAEYMVEHIIVVHRSITLLQQHGKYRRYESARFTRFYLASKSQQSLPLLSPAGSFILNRF
jgi:lipopolysaccharide biosynthesis glycosyltransferase